MSATAPKLLATCWTTAGAVQPLTDQARSPEEIADRVRIATEAGFAGFGVLHADLVVIRDSIGYEGFARLLSGHGVEHVELEMLVDWWTTGPAREASDRMRRDLVEAAAALGARHIKVGGDFARFDWPLESIARELRVLCRQAAAAGARIAFEPMPFSNIRTPREATRLIEMTGDDAAGMVIDIWHVVRAGVEIESLADIPGELIVSVELDDADDQPRGTLLEDTVNNRRLCGQGSFDLPAFIRAIARTGYDGPWGVEILSHEHRATPIEEAIPAAFSSAMRQFELASGAGA